MQDQDEGKPRPQPLPQRALAVQPAAEPAGESATEPAAGPTTEPAAESAAEPTTEPPRGAARASDARSLFSRGAGVSPLERRLLTQTDHVQEEELGELRREAAGLRKLLEVSREISSILDPDALLEAILDSAIVLTGADRGLLLLSEDGRLGVVSGRGREQDSLDPAGSQISETLARQCLAQNRVIPFDNISQLPELREIRSIRALALFAAVCVPLRQRGAPIGVLYLDSTRAGLRTTALEISLLEAFASQAAIAMLNARLLKRLEESRVILTRENSDLRAKVQGDSAFANILGRSPAMMALFDKIRLLKDSDISLLLLGESGTGKELIARALHYEGLRGAGPFVPVNCAGLPADLLDSIMFGHRRGAFTGATQDSPGLVEQADGGTLFLDEVGDMPLVLQVKLLRFLESGEFRRVGENEIRRAGLRVISATNQDLTRMVRERTFREDLYFRLAGTRLEIPPLRSRREDIPLLIEHFFEAAQAASRREIKGMSDRARAYLIQLPWPGNVRQLKHAIEGACALVPEGEMLDEAQLRMQFPEDVTPEPESATAAGSLKESRSRMEREKLEAVLAANGWNVSRAARALGISRQHLHNRIRLYELHRPRRGT